jgi:hypothetical protein
MVGRDLTARERNKVGPVAQADDDNQGSPGRLPQGHTLMRLKLKALA